MTTLFEKLTVSVTTDCVCDEGDTDYLTEYCSGDCYEWQKSNDIDESDPILIETDKLGWRNASAYKWTTMLELDGALAFDGDFRIEWYLENGELTARRWSHDEPVGTGLFTFTHYKGCDKCGEPVKADINAEKVGFCVERQHEYFDHSDEE